MPHPPPVLHFPLSLVVLPTKQQTFPVLIVVSHSAVVRGVICRVYCHRQVFEKLLKAIGAAQPRPSLSSGYASVYQVGQTDR